MVTRFILNDRTVKTDLPAGTTALEFLRNHAGLKGTKEGCREGDCGACVVLVGRRADAGVYYTSVCSCLYPIGDLEGCHLVTIEGINDDELTPVQQAIVAEGATQCGFCTPGIIVSLTGFFLSSQLLTSHDAVMAVEGNICRCTGYVSISRAVSRLCDETAPRLLHSQDRLQALVRERIVPRYFVQIPARLAEMAEEAITAQSTGGQLFMAGGTDLLVQRPEEVRESELCFLSRAGLDSVFPDGDDLVVGAGVSTETIRTSTMTRAFFGDADLRLISSLPIRNRATVGGNLVNASPIGDLAIIFLALDAQLTLRLGQDRRTVSLARFFKGYKELDLGTGELVESLRLPGRMRRARFNFEKVSRRTFLDIASVNSALSISVEQDRVVEALLSAGGVAPVPLLLEKASRSLLGKPITSATIIEMAAVADSEIAPISDVRGSAEYKRLLLRQLICAHFNRLFGLKTGLP